MLSYLFDLRIKMSPNLTGKICLVTGAARGIGRGIAVQLGAAGATVYITGKATKVIGVELGGGKLLPPEDLAILTI